MSWTPTVRRRLILAAVTALLLTAGGAVAHEGATGVVAQRMDLMKAMGRHLKALNGMAAGQGVFDPVAARRIVETMQEHCRHMAHLFPAGSDGHHSEALPSVWTRRAEFEERWRRFDAVAADLASAAATGEKAALRAEVTRASQECAACHDDFRKRK